MAAKKRKKKSKPSEAEVEVVDASEEDVDVDGDEADFDDDVLAAANAASDSDDAGAEPAISSAAIVKRGQTDAPLARLDLLQAYMREAEKHPLLTREEEHALATKYVETGDVDAAARLVTANLRLVVKIAYEYRRAYRNMMDLVQEGNIGLMQAVKRYDPYRGVKLSSYAAWWIRAYMLRFILNNWRMVKLGTTQAQRKLFFNLNKEKAKLTALGIEPTHDEIANRLDVTKKEVVEMDRRLARGDASLDVPVGDAEGRQTSRLDLLPATGLGPEQLTESAELSELVRERLEEFRETLSGKDLKIYDERMIAEDPLTLQQLGDQFGVSRERVRQLEARISGRLREFLREALGDSVTVGG